MARRRTGIAATSSSIVNRVGFDQLGPERAKALNAVDTRFKLPAEQVDAVIAAGRDALRANPTYREFLGAAPRADPAERAASAAERAGRGRAVAGRAGHPIGGHGLYRRPRSRALALNAEPQTVRAVPGPRP